MQIKIIGEHLSVTEAISNYIQDKFSHVPTPDKLQHVEFRLGKEKEKQYVHFLAHCAKEDYVIKTTHSNLYSAIDNIMQKIQRSFIKTKEKHKTHLHKELTI